MNDWSPRSARFDVCLVPETLAKTTFGNAVRGTKLNIEIDRTGQILVDTIDSVIRQTLGRLRGVHLPAFG